MPPVVRAQLDYYAVLDLYPSANTADINAAFRRLAWRYHPDRNPAPGATLQFQDINEAHQVLSDPERRVEYDAKWHPQGQRVQRRPERPTGRAHYGRTSHRRRRIRAVLMSLFAFVFVSSAWAVIFVGMKSARYSTPSYALDVPPSFGATTSQSCAISMEMFPVRYIDERGRQSTAWETDVRNCWGGSAWVSSVPNVQPERAFGDPSRLVSRY